MAMQQFPAERVSTPAIDADEQLRYAIEILRLEGRCLLELAGRVDRQFCLALDCLYHCRGSVIVAGMGKAGLIGQKIAATLSSTGTRSHFLHPAEAVHGDLGRIHADDIVLILSQSGETEEITRLLPSLTEIGARTIAITGRADSTLGRAATVCLELGPLQEACSLGLAPSTSTTAMLAIGDAIALVLSRMRNFGREDFARFHPAGALGMRLSKVEHHMRPRSQCRVVSSNKTVRQVYIESSLPGRRTGAIMIVDDNDRLVGVFTDSDLARLFERRRDAALDGLIGDVMTVNPSKAPLGAMLEDALAIMAERKISELPIVDAEGRPQGLIDITDVGIQAQRSATPAPRVVPRPMFADHFLGINKSDQTSRKLS